MVKEVKILNPVISLAQRDTPSDHMIECSDLIGLAIFVIRSRMRTSIFRLFENEATQRGLTSNF